MPQIQVLNSPPKKTDKPETFPLVGGLPQVLNLGSCSGIDVDLTLKSGAAAVGVRPWFNRNGYWFGLGVDGNPSGTTPLVADPANLNGDGQPYGHGRFIKDRTNIYFCLVRTSGLLSDIEAAFMDGSVFGDLP